LPPYWKESKNRVNRIALATLVTLAVLTPAVATAELSHTYSDPAMSFTAPADYTPIPMASHDPAKFDDGPAIMAAYVHDPKGSDATSITLRMDAFSGDVHAWQSNQDDDLRNQSSSGDVFISHTDTHLPNGMPAVWESVTIGSGFNQIKSFQYLWADGVRGVTLSLVGREGAIGEDAAKQALSNVSAVAYPKYRDY
jgi:hypothetical protein